MSTKFDSFHFVVYRFPDKNKRDEVRKALRVFDNDGKDVPNIDDYLATGVDEQGYYFIVSRDAGVVETAVYTYTSDGVILKNNVNPESYRNIFNSV